MAILRVGLGLHLAAYCFALRSSWNHLLANTSGGLIGREVAEAFISIQSPWIPKISWLLKLATAAGIDEQSALSTVWGALFCAALLLIAGFFCRAAAIFSWLLHLCVAKSGGLVSYGVDNLMTIGLFYLMLSPLPDRYALDAIWRRRPPGDAALLGFFRRVLQVHLCIIYFFGGLTKALGSGWWNGENIWRALTRPPFDVLPTETVASWAAILPALGISVWVIELLYPMLIWPSKTRLIWLVLICLMHFGIGFAMGMHLFAAVMIVLNVAAFGPIAPSPVSISPQSEPVRI